MGKDETLPEGRYYTVSEYFRKKYHAVSRQMGLKAETVEEYEVWKNGLRAELKKLLGLDRMRSCQLNAEISGEAKKEGYRRQRVVLQTEPGVFMPLFVLIPDDMAQGERRPAVIAAHGHQSAGKLSIAGIDDIPAVAEVISRFNYAYGVEFVKKGFVVFCPDARGFGERREGVSQGDSGEALLNSSCFQLNNMAVPLGQTVTGMWVWDLMRLIDYISERPECDAEKIGCAGLSGGGLQSLWLAALDDRVKCAGTSGYFYGYRQSLLEMPNGCSCNYIPHLWEKVDMGDLGALIAPRPFFVETGDKDDLNGEGELENVYPQVEIAKKAYTLFGKEENLFHHVFAAGHRWSGKGVDFLWKHLMKS